MVSQPNHAVSFLNHHGPVSDCPVSSALRCYALRGLAKVTCEMQQGMAILHGRVTSYYLKQLAQEVVKNVDGVDVVINRVNVCQAHAG
ncbi:MAG: BON domain-containing protein [Bythopirellula sp.]